MSTKKEAVPLAKRIVENVLQNEDLLKDVYQALSAKEEKIRYPNAIAIGMLSEQVPEKIYPNFDYFVELMRSDNAYHRAIAVTTIADLTKMDTEGKFEEIFDDYFALIGDKK